MEAIAQQSMNITYETLFDILRAERRRDDVQELPVTFFEDVVYYLKQKKELIIKKEHESGVDAFDEIKAMKIQYENAQKIVKEIYERREKKILFMALNKSRTKMALQPKYLLQQEQEFHEQLTRLLNAYRGDVAEKLMNGIQPKQEIAAVLSSLAQGSIQKEGGAAKGQNSFGEAIQSVAGGRPTRGSSSNDMQNENFEAAPLERSEFLDRVQKEEMQKKEAAEKAMTKIKFLQETGQFLGSELETYGPFAPEAVAEIPAKIAVIFMTKGIAEEVKE